MCLFDSTGSFPFAVVSQTYCCLRICFQDQSESTAMMDSETGGIAGEGSDDFNYGYNFEFTEKSIRLGESS